mgnify:CR=1 FL=1
MALIIKRRKNESLNNFLARVFMVIKGSGILLEAKKRKYYLPPLNERSKKLSALYRLRKKEEEERKKKDLI